MDKVKLRKLARFVRKIPASQFDMGTWYVNSEDNDHSTTSKCGSVGCVMGHAAICKLFPGLKFERKCNSVSYKAYYGIQTAIYLFDLSYQEAQFLFMPGSYPFDRQGQPAYVANRIESFIKTNGANMQVSIGLGGFNPLNP